MKCKLTPWETRNLGVPSSIEFYAEPQDCGRDITEILENSHEVYQVMHVPCGNTDVLLAAQKCGFRLMEMNIHLGRDLKAEVILPNFYKRFESALECSLADRTEMDQILSMIRTGKMFMTDKIARDPEFSPEQAGNRYALWSADVLEQGAKLFCVKYKKSIIGFNIICFEEDGKVAIGFLGGVLPEIRYSGLGFAVIYLLTKCAQEMGCKKINSGISSNNIAVLKLYELFGYSVQDMNYCLIKHLHDSNYYCR